jgi:hypothetical protein
MKTVDMYSVMHALDDIKAERDDWYATNQGYMQANNHRGQNSQSFSLEKSQIVKKANAKEFVHQVKQEGSVFSDSDRFEKLVNLDFSFN